MRYDIFSNLQNFARICAASIGKAQDLGQVEGKFLICILNTSVTNEISDVEQNIPELNWKVGASVGL